MGLKALNPMPRVRYAVRGAVPQRAAELKDKLKAPKPYAV